MDTPGREVLEGAAVGDNQASAELIRQVKPFVRAVLRTRQFDSADELDDVEQQVLIQVLRVAKSFDESRGAFAHFVWGITRNVYNNHVRQREGRSETVFSDLGDDYEAPNPDTDAHTESPANAERVRALRAVYAKLNPRQQSVVDHMLRHGAGVGRHKDLGQTLGISEAAAKQEVYRMKKKLRELIEAEIQPPVIP